MPTDSTATAQPAGQDRVTDSAAKRYCQCVVTVTHAGYESLIACPNEAAEGNGDYCHYCTADRPCWKAWDE